MPDPKVCQVCGEHPARPRESRCVMCAECRVLEGALRDLEQHCVDLHEQSSPPCPTWAQSKQAFERGRFTPARLDGEDTG